MEAPWRRRDVEQEEERGGAAAASEAEERQRHDAISSAVGDCAKERGVSRGVALACRDDR